MKQLSGIVLILLLMLPLCLTVFADGEAQEAFVPDDAFESVFMEYPHDDGSVTMTYRDGSVGTKYADGSFEGVDGNGNRHTKDKDGTYTVYGTDGTIAVERPDGTQEMTERNGRKTVINPDGSGKTVHANGLVIEHDADHNQTSAYFEGGKDRLKADKNGEFPEGEIRGKNGEILKNTENGLYLKGANGVEYELDTDKDTTSITFADGGTAKTEGENGEIRFADGAVFTMTGGQSKFMGADGSYVYIDKNSDAWEMYNADDGTHVKVDEAGELTDLYQENDGNVLHIENGQIKEWKDVEAGITIRCDENGTTVETPEGTYFTDGKGTVTKDGEPLQKEEEANPTGGKLPDGYDDTQCDDSFDNEKLWRSKWNEHSFDGEYYDKDNGIFYADWIHQVWDDEHKQLYLQERYDMTVKMQKLESQNGEWLDDAWYSIEVADCIGYYKNLDEINMLDGQSRMELKVDGYDAVYVYSEDRDPGDPQGGVLPYAWNKGKVYVQIGDLPNCYGKVSMLVIGCDIQGYSFDIFDSMLEEYLSLLQSLPCDIEVEKEEQVFREMDAGEQAPTGDPDYKKYSGRLTYTNGGTNKYGQPWPDLMDFDGDGDIDYADRQIQHVLVHNPDAMDTPEGFALVMTAVIAAIAGAGGGSAFAILSGSLGSGGARLDLNFDFSGEGEEGEEGEEKDGSSDPASEDGSGQEPEQTPPPAEKEDLGPYIYRDADGDLNVRDPATGENRLYTANGDGTYTNPLTGATYTERELKDSLDSRAENAGLICQDNAAAKDAIDAQREENQGKSWIAEEAEAENAAQRAREAAEADQNRYKEKLADKYGVYSGDDALYAEIGEKQGQAEIEGYEQREYEKEYKKSQDYVENVKKGADVAIDIYAEVDPTQTGKKLKDAYTVATAAASNAGDVMAGYKTVGGAIAQTAVDSGVELAKNHSEGVTQKLASNIMGDSVKAMSDTYMKGGSVEDIRQAGEGAAIQGGINAAVDVAFDAVGDKAAGKLGLTGDSVVGSIGGQQITKGMTGGAAKVVANTGGKDMLTPDDPDEVRLENHQAAQERAENDANAEAARHFREAQKEWAERNKE